MTATNDKPIPLTKQQGRVKKFIARYIHTRGYSPAIDEIQQEFGFASKNGVVCHLVALERKGHIVRDANIARSIRVVEVPDGN